MVCILRSGIVRTHVVLLSQSLCPAMDSALSKVLQDRLDFLGLVHSDAL